MSCYLGADIGGTKSHVLIADDNGQVLGFGTAGPGNHEVVGYEGLAEALHKAARQALVRAGLSVEDISGAGFGIAGYDWPSELPPTQHAVSYLGLVCPQEIVNDTLLGLIAGSEQGWGVVVVGGTGSNAWGIDANRRTGRMTGGGYLFGEHGGGSDIVLRAVQAAAREWTQVGPKSMLTQALLTHTGAASLEELLEGLALDQFSLGASAATLVFEAARRGDPTAEEIVHWAGEQLALHAIGVIRQLGIQDASFDVVLVGSLFKAGPMLLEPFKQTVLAEAPAARMVPLAVPPVIGAVLLGMEAAGLDYRLRRAELIRSYQQQAGGLLG
jgi:N-acetylglucosamine kinase-like BadF-type ATPase